MVEVGRFDTRTAAEVARSLLSAAGIPCILAPVGASGAYPLDGWGGACLLVADADIQNAGEILRRHGAAQQDH